MTKTGNLQDGSAYTFFFVVEINDRKTSNIYKYRRICSIDVKVFLSLFMKNFNVCVQFWFVMPRYLSFCREEKISPGLGKSKVDGNDSSLIIIFLILIPLSHVGHLDF